MWTQLSRLAECCAQTGSAESPSKRLVASKEAALVFLGTTPLAKFLEVFVLLDEATEEVTGDLWSVAGTRPSFTMGADLLEDTRP